MKSYKTISGVDLEFAHPFQSIAIKIDIAIERDLTEDEQYEVTKACGMIAELLRKNTLLTDPSELYRLNTEKEKLLQCFAEAIIYAKAIPNEYYNKSIDPWFLVTTNKGVIKIGWRKRVIVIDWTDSDISKKPKDLFPKEDVTKAEDYENRKFIHAWGYEKAKEYISKLLQQ